MLLHLLERALFDVVMALILYLMRICECFWGFGFVLEWID